MTFPDDADCATVVLFDAPTIADNLTGFTKFNYNSRNVGKAAGDVAVPADAFVGLNIVARQGYVEFLNGLAGQKIHHIEIAGPTLSSELLANLENISDLRLVRMTGCVMDDALDTAKLKGAPKLQHLVHYMKSGEDEGQLARLESQIASWASKCPQLQFFRSNRERTIADLQLFENHQSPLFLSVSLGADSDKTIEALSQISSLIGLNVEVTEDAPDDFHRELAKLKSVELFNWSNGELNEDLLDSLSRMSRLRTVRFQGQFEVWDEFIGGLSKLEKLESISFNSPLSEEQDAMLLTMMIKMDGIRKLPKITNVSAEVLNKLKDRGNLQTISLSGLADEATPQLVADVIRANPDLTWIDIDDIELTTELGAAISECSALESLNLSVFDFDASRIKNPKSLVKLQRLSLDVNGIPRNLEALGKIPNLFSIQISLSTLNPKDWSFIADVSSLQYFNILDGYCDDSIVKWIKQNKNIRVFSTLQDCVMTDVGAAELCECEHLESLTIGGFISTKYVEKLARLPNLARLTVCTDLIADSDKESLKLKLDHLSRFSLRELHPTSGSMTIGGDGLYRRDFDGGRDNFDVMEGESIDDLLGEAWTDQLNEELAGKVVLVEFWGTWCGPCLKFIPELERLQNQYGKRGFQVLGIHSKAKADSAEAYLKKNPKPWPNVTDHDGSLAISFEVPSYPSLYLFGKDGRLRIAQPHRLGLDRTLSQLLDE